MVLPTCHLTRVAHRELEKGRVGNGAGVNLVGLAEGTFVLADAARDNVGFDGKRRLVRQGIDTLAAKHKRAHPDSRVLGDHLEIKFQNSHCLVGAWAVHGNFHRGRSVIADGIGIDVCVQRVRAERAAVAVSVVQGATLRMEFLRSSAGVRSIVAMAMNPTVQDVPVVVVVGVPQDGGRTERDERLEQQNVVGLHVALIGGGRVATNNRRSI